MDQEIIKNLPKLPRKLRLLSVICNHGGCAYYRLIMPSQKIKEHLSDFVDVRLVENPLKWKKTGQEGKQVEPYQGSDFEDLDWADIVFTCNIHDFGGYYDIKLLEETKKRGKIFHFDTDDLLTDLYSGHRHYDNYKKNQLDDMTKHIYHNSDVVTVTQRKFAERIVPFMGGGILAICKNNIDYNLKCWNLPKEPSKKQVRIGWIGGIHHEEDLKEFTGVMMAVNQAVGLENVKWNFYGRPYQPEGKKDWQSDVWDNYQKLLTKGAKKSNVQIFYALPTDQYGVFYTTTDIAIAPLQMNPFNDSKSEIKVMECGRYGIPLVCSDVGCYDEVIKNGETGFLISQENTITEWKKRLTYLVKNKLERERMGKNLKQTTDSLYDINKNIHLRYLLYLEAIKRRNYEVK